VQKNKEILTALAFVSTAAIAMTMWLGLIGYGAWHFLFG
jgi:hypothetical protein